MIFSDIAKSVQSFFAPPTPIQKTSLLLTAYVVITALTFLIFIVGSFGVLFFPASLAVSLISLACLLLLCVLSPCIGYCVTRSSSLVEQKPPQAAKQDSELKMINRKEEKKSVEKISPSPRKNSLPSLFSIQNISLNDSSQTASFEEDIDDEETLIQTTVTPRPKWL